MHGACERITLVLAKLGPLLLDGTWRHSRTNLPCLQKLLEQLTISRLALPSLLCALVVRACHFGCLLLCALRSCELSIEFFVRGSNRCAKSKNNRSMQRLGCSLRICSKPVKGCASLSKNKHRTNQQLAKNETEQAKQNLLLPCRLPELENQRSFGPHADPTDGGHRTEIAVAWVCV